MRSLPALGRLTLVATLWLPAASATALVVSIVSPPEGRPAFGTIALTAEITDEPETTVTWVRFFVDDQEVAELRAPPWSVTIELGESNRSHRFEVLAESSAGETRRSLLVTPAVPIDLVVDLALQQLYLTVTRQGSPALDLPRSLFSVFDDGVPQEIVTFERGDVPFTAVLLLDASLSMSGRRLEAALTGARSFFSRMAPLDQARLLLFSDRIVHDTPFTSFPEVLETGLGSVEARGGTSINDHLYLALKSLEARQGRRLVVLLSDGVDLTSGLRMEEVYRVAERSRSQLYWIRLGAPVPGQSHFSAWRDAEGHRRELELLERTVVRSGGRVVTLQSVEQAPGAFTEILEEIRGQYVLGYYPSTRPGDGSWHKIRVRVGGGFRARARAGYFDF